LAEHDEHDIDNPRCNQTTWNTYIVCTVCALV